MASFLSDAKARLQHNNMLSLAPRDIKNLAEIISTEKSLINSSSKLSLDYRKSADALKEWGLAEGDDLADVLSKLAILFGHLSDAQSRFSDHDGTYRIHFKSIRMREENLTALKKNKDTVQGKIVTLEKKITKMSTENKDLPALTSKLQEFRSEFVSLEHSVSSEEARLSDFKRDTVREGMGLRLGAMLELAEKMTIICELGKMIVAEVPFDRTPIGGVRAPYQSAMKTSSILEEAQRCLTEVIFNPSPAGVLNEVDPDEPPHALSPEFAQTNQFFSPPQSHHHPQPPSQAPPSSSGNLGLEQRYPTENNHNNHLPAYARDSQAPESAYAGVDQTASNSSPNKKESRRAYSPPPRIELNPMIHDPQKTSSSHIDPDPIAAAAAHLRQNYDDSTFYVRGADGKPISTGPGSTPQEQRWPHEQNHTGSNESGSLSANTPATHGHDPSHSPVHRASNLSTNGNGNGWSQENRTTNAGAFRRGPPPNNSLSVGGPQDSQSINEPSYQTEEGGSTSGLVQPLNVQKRKSKTEVGSVDRSPTYSSTIVGSGFPNAPPSGRPGSSGSPGFGQNRYVTNLD
ncbi:Eisosome component PIL1-domain-containing protein [Melampsora americana]|nr:Eisosome component PIL1-domain-containing protein [Melampsora americana]